MADLTILWAILGVLAGLAVLFFLVSYVKAAPNEALVVSGWPRKTPKFLIGTGGIRIPGLQRSDSIYLGQISVDIKTPTAVPTRDYIDVKADAVAKVRISPEHIALAAANFLNKRPADIAAEIQDSLQGNMREIIGAQELKSLTVDRDGFSNQIQSKAAPDMEKLGIEILSCNIQTITDNKGLIEQLGADNTCKITKEAQINKANADRDVDIARSAAAKEANDARVAAEQSIAEQNTQLALKKAELKRQQDLKQAIADSAYEIQKQEQQVLINQKTVEAETTETITRQSRQREINRLTVEAQIEKAEQEKILREREIEIKERQLAAEIEKQAAAEKVKKETDASAELEQRKREAEAKRYEAEQEAAAVKAKAAADLFAQQQKAAGIEAVGKAEAEAIRAKGEAEAAAMDKKAEAFRKYDKAAMAKMAFDALPTVVANAAAPIAAIKDVHVYGTTGQEAAGISGNVPVLVKQSMDVMQEATGVDLAKIMQENSKVVAAKADVKH